MILWADTFNNHFHPEIAAAAVEVLESAGFSVRVPKAHLCCGRPLYDFGMLDTALNLLHEAIRTLRPAIEDPTQRATFAAVLAIFAFADVPIVYFSIQWWRTQHPSPVLTTGGLAPGMGVPLSLMTLAFALLGTALLLVRLQQETMSREIDSLRRQAHAL